MSATRMQAAAATALSAAAVKAKMLAEQEEREIQRLTIELIDLQVGCGGHCRLRGRVRVPGSYVPCAWVVSALHHTVPQD